ncbi:MAG: homocysteine S-methyltransferase family protein [Thermomicrobiales bacterium]|nr:homocysteine S-methyltransferase family protein [Thermomicrobiales bacterium]
MATTTVEMSERYQRIDDRLKAGGVVVLDGGIGSELQEVGYPEKQEDRRGNYTWGSLAIEEAPDKLIEVHRRFAEAGADALETHTFALNRIFSAVELGKIDLPRDRWKDLAIESVRLVREGARKGGNPDALAVFACRTMDWPPEQQEEANDYEGTYVPLDMERYLKPLAETLANATGDDKPDVVLMEIQKEIPENLEFPDYQVFLDTGIPLWIAYRRTIGKIVGVAGETISEDGDRFGHAAKKFEEMGASAVLVNCLPPKLVDGVGTWLRQFTDITLGAYPNMGSYIFYEWDWTVCPSPDEFAAFARTWIDEGMQIIGGCCGTRPAHIRALADAVNAAAV